MDGDTLTITTAPLTVLSGEEVRWSWYGRKYTRKHKNRRRSNLRPRGGESRYLLGVSEARRQKETKGVEHAREDRN
jgi:hypothetical protein